ncbi:hypothetical protein SAMN02745194_02278 [Roseomonas rosea]|uniref:Uncharacterized protein n=1 Tax=Muricoccus roseus TaxID=198092 RepID=A0A1M6I9N4_9PROT|nr:hypothetical protein [Roseomonas rosea]SHJ31142.1 hypothetical protein SAMN02745194_02278 [Roseomonas rosea]
MAIPEGSLTAASPTSDWFAPTGPFRIWRDGGTGTLALHERAAGDTGNGVDTGATLTAAGSMQGEAGYRGTSEFRLVLTGAGPVAFKVFGS